MVIQAFCLIVEQASSLPLRARCQLDEIRQDA
jgi:hypothetical protein